MTKRLFYLFAVFAMVACSRYPADVKRALILAGDNRAELEKVLNHYKASRADSLKYRAAIFLISNMPHYYSCEGPSLDKFRDEFDRITRRGMVGKQALDSVELKLGPLDYDLLIKKRDVFHISSDYLINSIEHSFMVREKQPWGKHIPFDVFCEFILPYRIKDEPLENWKPVYYQLYQPVLDSLLATHTILEACHVLFRRITADPWYFIMEMPPPHAGAFYLLEQRSGSCSDRCDLAIYVMRSLGIPAGVDMTLHNPDRPNRHFWNFAIDEQGATIEFTLWEEEPEKKLQTETVKEMKWGKVYRETFGVQKKQLRLSKTNKKLPGMLASLFLKDVSSEYFKTNKITFTPEEIRNDGQRIRYLSVFDLNGWHPVDWAEIRCGQVEFHNVEPRIVYALTEQDDYYMPVYYPFKIDEHHNKHYCIPDTGRHQTIQLERKYSMKFMQEHMKRFNGGFFEVSNSGDFSNSTVLYTIDSISTPKYYDQVITVPNRHRFIRYYSPDSSLCNMAELIFYDENGQELQGKIIGTDGAWGNEERLMKQAVFDREPLTFFNAAEDTGVWVGLDFGKPQTVKKIIWLPRNDDNFIREGDVYELFYFDKDGIVSLGRQTGDKSQVLTYENAPANALFWLRNLTRGKEERIFSYENKKQVWW